MASSAEDDRYYYDAEAGDRAVSFFSHLRHWSGEWKGKRFHLEPWQADEVVRPLFGWKRRSDNLRRYRQAYIEVPKKNGKTPLAAGIALTSMYTDGEPGAECYAVAVDRSQAEKLLFADAKHMVELCPALRRRSKIFRRSIVYGDSRFEVLSADVKTKHGVRPHLAAIDELHAWKSREMWDVLVMGTAARRQPLIIAITTAGVGQEGICFEQHDYARKVLDGTLDDPTYLPVIYAAPDDADFTDPEVWKAANPNLGVTVKIEYLETECKKALATPTYQNEFRRFHLNQWVGQYERAIDMGQWDACRERPEPAELVGRECYAGLDLSSRLDITALVLVFPHDDGTYSVLPHYWIPEENVLDRARRDRAPYDVWLRDGIVETTAGNQVDQEAIRKRVVQLAKLYRIVTCAFDPWNAVKVATELAEQDGIRMVECRQGYKTLSQPTKSLIGLVADGRLRHGGDPALRWQADALSLRKDENDNWRPDKKRSTQRIDGIVALIMALSEALQAGERAPLEIFWI